MGFANILIFNNLFSGIPAGLTEAIGGTQSHVSELVKYLSLNDFSVYCAGYCAGFEDNRNVIPLMASLEKTNSGYLKQLVLNDFANSVPGNTVIHAHRPDHLAVIKNNKKLKTVLTLHGQPRQTIKGSGNIVKRLIYNSLEKNGVGKADRIIVTDKITEEYYSVLFPEIKSKIIRIPVGIDTDHFRPIDKSVCCRFLNLDETKHYIVYVGRLDFPKKVKEIIDAFSMALEMDTNLLLYILGEGKDKNGLIDFVNRKNIQKKVVFMGYQPKDVLPYYYNMADLTVLLSGNEGSPTSIKESLACGVPVIANRVGDVGDVVQNQKNGFLAESLEPDYLASQIFNLLSLKIDKDQCRKSVEAYDNRLLFSKIAEVYKHINF